MILRGSARLNVGAQCCLFWIIFNHDQCHIDTVHKPIIISMNQCHPTQNGPGLWMNRFFLLYRQVPRGQFTSSPHWNGGQATARWRRTWSNCSSSSFSRSLWWCRWEKAPQEAPTPLKSHSSFPKWWELFLFSYLYCTSDLILQLRI